MYLLNREDFFLILQSGGVYAMPPENLFLAGKGTRQRQITLAFLGLRRKARATLGGQKAYIDDLLRFFKIGFQNGHSLAAMAGTLELSYDEVVELSFILRRRMKALRKEKQTRLLKGFAWN